MRRNILLIQSDSDTASVIQQALCGSAGASFEVERVARCADAVDRLSRHRLHAPDSLSAVLVDLYLSDSQGVATFERLHRAAPEVPFLVLSPAHEEETARLAVRHGAQDYLLIDHIDDYSLPKMVENMIERSAGGYGLLDERERASDLLNSIGDAVASADINGRITYLNVIGEWMTGWSLAEAAGLPATQVIRLVDDSNRKRTLAPMIEAARAGQRVRLSSDCQLVPRNGPSRAVETCATPIHNREGEVTGAVMVFRELSQSHQQAQRMSYLAYHDPLTGLPNRVLFNDRLIQAMSMADRHGTKLAVLFLDIDHFKHINDSLGHVVGDQVLQSVARRLLGCVRESDTVCRQGGDEFVVLLSELAQSEDAAVTAAKILGAVSAIHQVEQHVVHLSTSIGIVVYPDDERDAKTLMSKADIAMYHAKDNGRDNYTFFKETMNQHAVERQLIAEALHRALEEQQFTLHYQPKLNLDTGAIVGVEALLRWNHPSRGLLPPHQFIAVAENSGLIEAIGRWVLREACEQACRWREAGLPAVRIAVNVSAMELRGHNFVNNVRRTLTECGLPPALLELELKELFLLQDSRVPAVVLTALKDLGVELALDDFGTGYSSLSSLKRFPLDTLKIDPMFVRDITSDQDDASIVSAIIGMGRSLRLRVAAEGVETAAQLAFLRSRGCHEAQGRLFSEPLVADGCAQLLRAGALRLSA